MANLTGTLWKGLFKHCRLKTECRPKAYGGQHHPDRCGNGFSIIPHRYQAPFDLQVLILPLRLQQCIVQQRRIRAGNKTLPDAEHHFTKKKSPEPGDETVEAES